MVEFGCFTAAFTILFGEWKRVVLIAHIRNNY